MSTYDAERDPSGKRRDELGEDVGESPRPGDPARPAGGETPRDRDDAETEVDPEAGENPS